MDRSLGFGSMPCNSTPCSDSVSLRLRDSHPLTSLHVMTRRLILQKARRHPFGLRPLAGPWFQVLFHSPPGVLFTFPSRYYSLSVIRSYLALGDGPPSFPPNFSCSMVLWILTASIPFRLQGFHLILPRFPTPFSYFISCVRESEPLTYYSYIRFRLLPVRSPLLSESLLFSFPSGT